MNQASTLINVATLHALQRKLWPSNCCSGVPCGGHAWSYDGLTGQSRIGLPSVQSPTMLTTQRLLWDYVERPQVAQMEDGITTFL